MNKNDESDNVAISNAIEWLKSQGFINIVRHCGGRDIEADKNGRHWHYVEADKNGRHWHYYIEVKSSRKPKEQSIGSTVMFTEWLMASLHKDNYLFIVCQGDLKESFDKWMFQILTPEEFLPYNFLSTPLFRYAVKFGNDKKLLPPTNKTRKGTIRASWKLINLMDESVKSWKTLEHECEWYI